MLTGKFGKMGLGLMGLSGNYGEGLSDKDFIAFVQGALDRGMRMLDTADAYDRTAGEDVKPGASGHNERLLGEAIRTYTGALSREDIFIASKCGFDPADWSLNLNAAYIRKACEQSLENLGLGYIDLYYLHRVPRTLEEFEPCLEVLAQLISEGKIHHVGLSEASPAFIRFAHDYFTRIGMPQALLAVESEFSIFSPHHLYDGVISSCDELGIAFVPYSPLCRGLLTEAFTAGTTFGAGDFRALLPRFNGENFLANLAMRDELAKIAAEKSCTLSQLALAWTIAKGKYVFPIPGTRSLKRLEENLGAASVNLTDVDLARIARIVSKEGAHGERYTEAMRKGQNLPMSDYQDFGVAAVAFAADHPSNDTTAFSRSLK
jgi:aryl-alcohol dehydrogenase-like predicted oxidoreductase